MRLTVISIQALPSIAFVFSASEQLKKINIRLINKVFFNNSFYSASKNFDLIKSVVISHAVFIIVSHIALTAFSVSG